MRLFKRVPRKDLVFYLELSLIYLAIAAVMLWPITTDMAGRVLGIGGDPYQSLWGLWWVGYATFTLHSSIYFTNLLFYPAGAELLTQTMFPLIGILAYPLQAVNLAFEMNVVVLVSFMLSGLFMYFLAFRFTKNRYASFVAGFVYTFSAMHFAHTLAGHLDFVSIEFVPLFLLFFLDLINQRKVRSMIYAAVALLFVTFAGDLTQGLMALLLVAVILLYTLATKRRSILNKRFASLLLGMFAIVFVLGSWAFIPILNGVRSGALSTVNGQSEVNFNEAWSLDLAAYLLPSWTNGLFSNVILNEKAYYNIYKAGEGERAGYIGYTVILLVLIAVTNDKGLRRSGMWLLILVVFALLALGPYVQVMGTTTSVPGPYLAYRLIPVLNIIREPGRFDLLATVALAMLAAMGLDTLMGQVKNKKLVFGAVVVFLLIEYNGAALSTSSTAYRVVNTTVPATYPQIANETGNYSVLVLPGLTSAYTGMAMYYQTVFHKPILEGYVTRGDAAETIDSSMIPLISQTWYNSSYSYPIAENYSALSAFFLAKYGTRFVVVNLQDYASNGTTPDLVTPQSVLMRLEAMFGSPIYRSNTTAAFNTSAGLAGVGDSLVAYVTGPWEPGLDLCTDQSACSVTFSRAWWVGSTGSLTVYSPDSEDLNMVVQAYSLNSNEEVRVYLNSNAVDEIDLGSLPQDFDVPLQVNAGNNSVELVAVNGTRAAPGYGAIGIGSITFT